jgi:hypothetical protein
MGLHRMTIYEFGVSTPTPRRGVSAADYRPFHHHDEVAA